MQPTYAQQQRMDACFSEKIDRTCASCIAHPKQGGSCCFGTKFDYNDRECIDCAHSDDCVDIFEGVQRRTVSAPSYRTPTRPASSIPVRKRVIPTHHTQRRATSFPEEEISTRIYDDGSGRPTARPEESIPMRILKEGIWGGGVGTTYYMYKYLSNHYWS